MLTQAALKTMMTDKFPSTATNFTTLMGEAIQDCVAYAADKGLREFATVDWIGDGVTARVALPGRDVMLAAPDQQVTPASVDTAGIAAPTTTATVTADPTVGTFLAGTHYLCYAYQTPRGITQATAYASVVVTASKSLKIAALSGIPSTVTGVPVYVSQGPLDPDVRLVTTLVPANGTTTATVISAPATSSAAKPLVNYTALSGLAPNEQLALEAGIGPDAQPSTLATTLTVGTAPALGARVRIVFWRKPLAPTQDSDVIGLPDAFLRIGTSAFMAELLAINHVSGDSNKFEQAYKDLDALLLDLGQTAKGRPSPRLLSIGWV